LSSTAPTARASGLDVHAANIESVLIEVRFDQRGHPYRIVRDEPIVQICWALGRGVHWEVLRSELE